MAKKIVLFLFEINSKTIFISKLVIQLKLLPSLFELKDNESIDMSNIKKLQDVSRNRHFLISEAEKIIRSLLLSEATKNRLYKLMLMHVLE